MKNRYSIREFHASHGFGGSHNTWERVSLRRCDHTAQILPYPPIASVVFLFRAGLLAPHARIRESACPYAIELKEGLSWPPPLPSPSIAGNGRCMSNGEGWAEARWCQLVALMAFSLPCSGWPSFLFNCRIASHLL
jgi:hypothetical protein